MKTHLSVINIVLILQFRLQSAKCDLTCLACADSIAARDCQYVTSCGQHESCYLDSFVRTNGAIVHEMGCRDTSMCTPSMDKATEDETVDKRSNGNLLVCSGCCHGDLCNSALCGQTGYPTVSGSRGPVCYKCGQQNSPDICSVITECNRDQVCSLMTTRSNVVTSDLFYSTGCMPKHTCEAGLQGMRQANAIIGRKRYSDQVHSGVWLGKCCDEDLCNSNITYTSCKNPSYVRAHSTGVCLRLETSHKVNDDARNLCKQDGGDLVTIKSQAALNEVSKLLVNKAGRTTSYWIGLHRNVSSPSHFQWVDGTQLTDSNGGQFTSVNLGFKQTCFTCVSFYECV